MIRFRHFVLYKCGVSNILVFLVGEHFNHKKLPISVNYFSFSKSMLIFILVEKVVLLLGIQSALIMLLPA